LVPDFDTGAELTNALLAAVAVDDKELEAAAVASGLRFGAEAFTRGASLHHAMKAVNLLCAMVMHAMAGAVDNGELGGNVADGVWLAQRLQMRAGLISLAMMRGYTQAQGDALRDRFKHLRHDLRNPLGTIKSVLALMDDESVPAEARATANFRAMAKRNARTLEEIIADRLGDAAVPLPAIADRDVAVRDVAQSVRRELESEAKRRGVAIIIDAADIRGRFDVAGLELLLQGVVDAILREAHAGEQLRVSVNETGENRVVIRLSKDSSRPLVARHDALDRLASLARRIGASATFGEPIVISLPMQGRARGAASLAELEVPGDAIGLGVAETSHNLRRSREDDHGQANVL
jgi:signal transduction histidine kinase